MLLTCLLACSGYLFVWLDSLKQREHATGPAAIAISHKPPEVHLTTLILRTGSGHSNTLRLSSVERASSSHLKSIPNWRLTRRIIPPLHKNKRSPSQRMNTTKEKKEEKKQETILLTNLELWHGGCAPIIFLAPPPQISVKPAAFLSFSIFFLHVCFSINFWDFQFLQHIFEDSLIWCLSVCPSVRLSTCQAEACVSIAGIVSYTSSSCLLYTSPSPRD